MKTIIVALFCITGCALQVTPDNDDVSVAQQELEVIGREPPMMGIHHVRDAGPQAATNDPMTWHGGDIMTDVVVQPIFWGTKWSSTTFVGDKVGGLADFYTGYGGSSYAQTCIEYSGDNGIVGTGVMYKAASFDVSAAPAHAPRASVIAAEVCKMIASPVANGYYPVYVDTKRGGAGYCAWHSYYSCSGVQVQFAFFFNLDGDAGCDTHDTQTGHSQGLAALANVSGHELAEAMTDPRNGGWYDTGGSENADKCAWTFNIPYVTFLNTTIWKIQGEWSNTAYAAGSGYPNRSGQKACLDGH